MRKAINREWKFDKKERRNKTMKIGVRAHDYGKMEIEDLARTLHETGYECAQLALPKAFIGIDSYEDINLEKIDRIRWRSR